MKTDIEIAQEAVLEPVVDVAARAGIKMDDLELYGKYKAKISDEYINSLKDKENGKLILVTAINPTPAGEGKTTTSVGLGEAFGKRILDKKIKTVVFDRNGYLYHGVVQALADGARKAGVEF